MIGAMRSLLVLALLVGVAHAEPLVSVSLDLATSDHAFDQLTETHEDPGGLFARADVPDLGLKAGDIVRSINGASPFSMSRFGRGTLLYLDVMHGKQTLVVRVAVKPESHKLRIDRERYTALIDQLRVHDALLQLTKKNAASSVLAQRVFDLGDEGDVIRSVDATATNTIDSVLDALERARGNNSVVVKLERRGEPFTVTVVLSDPVPAPELSKIKKTSDTSYEIPRDVIDALLDDPLRVAKGGRIVPAMKDGKPDGLKLYAIRPASLFAAIGLQNGDTVQSVNGQALAGPDMALEVYANLRAAKQLVLGIERRGKAMTITYSIK